MRLSVVIPNLNSPVLGQTLAALDAQTWPKDDLEVVVVGQDSYGFVARFPFARAIDTGRPTSSAHNRNLGIRATSGDVVVFLDADGIPNPDWLARIATWFADRGVAAVGGGVVWPWDGPYWTACDNVSNFYSVAVSTPPGERAALPTLNFAVRRSALYRSGLFDESFGKAAGEDTDLCLRLRRAGYVLHFDPDVAVEHRHLRATLRSILAKAWNIGYCSQKLDPKWGDYALPSALLHPAPLALAAPFMAAAVTLRIARNPALRRRFVWPGVYLTKLTWCVGAVYRLVRDPPARRR
ncbi:MAG: glycosyltransferase [Anaerolineae bacterium]